MTTTEYEVIFDRILNIAWSGLYTDGAHHKQWHLERILTVMGHDLNDLRERYCNTGKDDSTYEWEPGIAP